MCYIYSFLFNFGSQNSLFCLVGGRFSNRITTWGSQKRGSLIHMYYPLFRSNEVWWCKALKIVWKESNRRKGLVGPYAKPTSLRGTSPNHLEAMHQSEPPHQWQMHSAAIKLRSSSELSQNQKGSPR